jgi:branched-chain amino acid transport system substrate-binding protein
MDQSLNTRAGERGGVGRRGLLRVGALAAALFAAAAMGLVPTGCEKKAPTGGGGGGAGGGGGGGAAVEPIKVGHFASLTGSEATFGISTDNGIKLAIKERNAAGGVQGRPITLITYDNQGKPQETQTVVTRLVRQDRVAAVLGEVASSRSMVGAPIAQQANVPMISPSSTNPDVTAIGDMIFRVCFIDPFQGYVGAKFLRENLKKSRGATLFNRAQTYSSGLNRNFVSSFTQMGGTIVTEQAYGEGDNDFAAQLSAIREANVEFIYVPGYYTEVVNIARQARSLGITAPLVGGDGWDSEELANAGDALNGSFFTNHYAKEDPRPEVQAFIAAYRAEYGSVPDGLAALGYDAARMLFDAMDRSYAATGGQGDWYTGRALAAMIASTKDFKGVTGAITIDKDRNASKDAVVLEIKDGVPTFVAGIAAPK